MLLLLLLLVPCNLTSHHDVVASEKKLISQNRDGRWGCWFGSFFCFISYHNIETKNIWKFNFNIQNFPTLIPSFKNSQTYIQTHTHTLTKKRSIKINSKGNFLCCCCISFIYFFSIKMEMKWKHSLAPKIE